MNKELASRDLAAELRKIADALDAAGDSPLPAHRATLTVHLATMEAVNTVAATLGIEQAEPGNFLGDPVWMIEPDTPSLYVTIMCPALTISQVCPCCTAKHDCAGHRGGAAA